MEVVGVVDCMPCKIGNLHSYGLCSYGHNHMPCKIRNPQSYGLCSYGHNYMPCKIRNLHSYGLCSYGHNYMPCKIGNHAVAVVALDLQLGLCGVGLIGQKVSQRFPVHLHA